MYTYIKKSIIGYYFESDVLIDSIDGYQDTVGTTMNDFDGGKFILLSSEQVQFHLDNPGASVYEVFNMRLTEPDIPEEPERTLEDAKRELHAQVDEYAESLKVFYIDGNSVWFSDRPALKLQSDAEIYSNEESITLYDDNDNPHVITASEAESMIYTIEHYNTKCQELVHNLHALIETIPSLEFADNVDINDYTQDAPEPPSFGIPSVTSYNVSYKYSGAYGDNSISIVNEGDEYSINIYPESGLLIEIASTEVMMGDETIPGQFDEDFDHLGYARSAYFAIKSVNGDISIIGTGVSIGGGDTPEPYSGEPESKDFYEVQYKITNCRLDNDITSVAAGDHWKTSIYPEDGKALYVPDFTAEMGGQPLDILFEPDTLGRPNYADSARIEVESVSGDIFVAGIAY